MGEAVTVRLAYEQDLPTFLEMGRQNVERTKQGHVFSDEIATETFMTGLATANPTIFMYEKDGKVGGMLLAEFGSYDYRAGFFIVQKVLYVKPENRGTRAAVILTKHLIDWSRKLGAAEIVGGNDNGFKSERTAAFLEHFGFRKVGYAMSLDIEGGNGR